MRIGFRLALVSLWVATAATVPSIGTAAAETLVVAGYASSFETVMREKVIPDFEREHGVTVQYTGGNSTDNLAKLMAQRDKPQFDVAMMDDGPMAQAVALGLCARVENSEMSRIQPLALFSEGKAVGMGMVATGLMYNKKTFAEQGWPAPTSWGDLKDVRFRGKVVVPPLNNGYGLLATVMLARMAGGSERNIEPSPAKMTELFQTNQAALAVWGSARYQAFADTGFPVGFVYPREGAAVLMTGVCPVAKKSASAKAQAFVATLLSAKVQRIMAENGGYAPVRNDVEVPDSGVMPVGARVKELVAVDWSIVNASRNDWNKRWSREIER
jgi:putative spermidine/putrescine transport system substrate-binding protein